MTGAGAEAGRPDEYLNQEEEAGARYVPPPGAPEILYRDEAVLFVDKPPGLLTVPGKGPDLADCLVSRLQGAFPEALLVHRLDRDTSGVIVFALSRAAQRHLGLQFERRHARKSYLALVGGNVPDRAGEVELPLAVDWPRRPRQKVDHDAGRPARTRWQALRRLTGATRMRLWPETGRSHQLRVHMAAIGHPILGDSLYGGAPAARLMLHAESLRLRHPEGGRHLDVRAPAPF